MTARILVSACLLGRPVRYNGSAKPFIHPALSRWQAEGRVVSICPELAAGFRVPRPPAEIGAGRSGEDVLGGGAQVIEQGGADVTALYLAGARAALALARAENCRFALLIDGSPSCGSSFISADTTRDQNSNASYFTVRVTLPDEERRRLVGLQLVSGMPAEVFMQTGSRTMLSYLFKPITDQLQRAFVER